MDKNTRAKLQAMIKEKLNWEDDVLPEYVLVMVGNGKTEAQVAEELETFLSNDAKEFSKWLWETLLSFNKGHKAESSTKPAPASQATSINREDDIVGSILGEDGDEFADPFEKEAEGDRTQEKPSRERERLTSERQRTAGGGRPTTTTGPRASHEPPRRDDRKRAREADESSERERERNKQPLSSFIGKVWASEETHIESDPERTKEERAKRLRNSSSALPARLVVSAVEQAAASTKRRPSQPQAQQAQPVPLQRVRVKKVSEVAAGSNKEQQGTKSSSGSMTKKRKHVVADDENSEAGGVDAEARAVSFTITLDGEPKLPRPRARTSDTSKPRQDTTEDNSLSLITGGDVGSRPSFGDDTETVQEEEVAPKRKRCTFWPQCTKGDTCPYHHPTENCKSFPNCQFGKKCLYIHPSLTCKFGVSCNRPNCNFTHPPPLLAAATMGVGFGMPMKQKVQNPCRNGFSCTTPNCKYSHPAAPCKFGKACTRGALCTFSHAPPCRYGAKCTRIGCTFSHFAKNTTWTSAQARCEAPIPTVEEGLTQNSGEQVSNMAS